MRRRSSSSDSRWSVSSSRASAASSSTRASSRVARSRASDSRCETRAPSSRSAVRSDSLRPSRRGQVALDPALEHADLVVDLVGRALGRVDRVLLRLHLEALGAELGLADAEREAAAVDLGLDAVELRLDHASRDRQLHPAMRRDEELEVADLGAVALVALGLLGLPLERGEAPLDLVDDVADAQQVLPRLVHLPLGGLLLGLELRDAGRLLDEVAAIGRLGRDDEADAALLDDRVGAGPDAGAEEEVLHVPQAALRAVDEVLAVALPIEAASDRDLGVGGVLGGGQPVGVVEGERHLREAVRATALRAVEDDVLHGLAAEVPGGLLAHGPADRVDDVGLAASVRPHDRRDVVVDVDDGPVHERLEAADLDCLDLHSAGFLRDGRARRGARPSFATITPDPLAQRRYPHFGHAMV